MFHKWTRVGAAAATATAATAMVAGAANGADVIHDNGLPDGVNGYSNATAGLFGFRRTLLDDFVVPPGQQWALEGIRWHAIHSACMGGCLPIGAEFCFRSDAAGTPGPIIEAANITSFSFTYTGNIYFEREEEIYWATFDDIVLPTGRYWFEGVIQSDRNNFWLTAPQQNEECWVNYEDLGGFTTGTDQFGVASDLAWRLEGRDILEPAACCFGDGSCVVESEASCAAVGGLFAGINTSCDSFACAPSSFCFRPDATYPAPGELTGAIALRDMDGQYGVDLVTTTVVGKDDILTIRKNTGKGTLGAPVEYPTVDDPDAITVADFDGDLDRDIAVVSANHGMIAIHINDGTGAIGPAVTYPAGTWPRALNNGDFDADLDRDLVVLDPATTNVHILINNGAGVFGPVTSYELPAYSPVAVAVGDLDGDLDLDLAVTHATSAAVSVLLNHGNGTFAPAVLYPAAYSGRDVITHDLDGDLDRDIAMIRTDQLAVLMNNGDGTFAPDVRYRVGTWSSALAVVDHDGDGTGDLVVTDSTTDEVTVLINDGAGVFRAEVTIGVGDDLIGVAVGDLDGDTDADLSIVSSGDGRIVTLLNDCIACPGDLDHSGAVDFADVLRILGAWGATGPEDLDGSGTVDFGDILVVLGLWGPCF